MASSIAAYIEAVDPITAPFKFDELPCHALVHFRHSLKALQDVIAAATSAPDAEVPAVQ